MNAPAACRSILIALIGAALAALSPVGALAQSGDPRTGLEIQPAQVYEDLAGASFSSPVIIVNHDDVPHQVQVRVRELGHDLDGKPTFRDSDVVSKAFKISAEKITLGAGKRAQLKLSGTIPKDRRSAYVGVVAMWEGAPGSNVRSRFELAAQFLLRGPKPWDQRVAVTDVGFLPGEGGKQRIFATVRNIGNVHANPQGMMEIRHKGKIIATAELEPNRKENPPPVLPSCDGGCARRLTAEWTPPPGAKGPFDLTARLRGSKSTLTRPVSLGVGKAVEAANVEFVDAPATGIVTLRVTNTGKTTLAGALVTAGAAQGDAQRARKVFPQPDLPPAASRDVEWRTDLEDGEYLLSATVGVGERILASAEARMSVGAAAGGIAPIDARGSRGVKVFLGALVALLLAGGLSVVLRRGAYA